MPLDLSAIYCYPLKSARGCSLAAARVDGFGISGDRRWMLIDNAGKFCSQRSLPRMALLEALSIDRGLRLTFAGDSIEVDTPGLAQECVPATIWGHTMSARCADVTVNIWLKEHLGEDLRLVFCPPDADRKVDASYLSNPGRDRRLGFADEFPLLVISQASLDDLNTRLPEPVQMDRFRPNLVIGGTMPYAEDGWRQLRVGSTVLSILKPCARCAVPSVNQQTAERDRSINSVLASYRRREAAIYFGMNAVIIDGEGFTVGDKAEVLA